MVIISLGYYFLRKNICVIQIQMYGTRQKRMQQIHCTRTLKMWCNVSRWTPNRVHRTLMATSLLCLVCRNPKCVPSFSQVRCHRECAGSFLASAPKSRKVGRLPCKCTTIPESVLSSFKAILLRKSLMPGESGARSKPKKGRKSTKLLRVTQKAPHKSEANRKSLAQIIRVSYQKVAQNDTQFLQIVAFFLTHAICLSKP